MGPAAGHGLALEFIVDVPVSVLKLGLDAIDAEVARDLPCILFCDRKRCGFVDRRALVCHPVLLLMGLCRRKPRIPRK